MVRFLKIVVAIVVAVPIVVFAIANRQVVPVSFDPFGEAGTSAALLTAPLFILLFLALIVGTFVGGVAAWLSQGANRRRLREAREEAERWRGEARRLREQPPMVMAAERPASGRAEPGRALVGSGR